MLQECNAAHVARRVPGVGALVVVSLQLAKVRGQQLRIVALDRKVNAVCDEGWSVAEEVNVFVHLLDHFEWQLAH